MIPPRVIREIIEGHTASGGSRIELLYKVAGNSHERFLSTILRDEEGRKTVERMDSSAFLRLFSIVLEKTVATKPRKRLPEISTIEKATHLLANAKRVLVLTGAGISTSCGIPDFRSASGVYSMLGEYPLSDPQDLFSIAYFRQNVKPFYHFARKLWPGTHKPAPTHYFIRALEKRGSLLRNYTQNIDTLENVAGITRVVQCHGSFATATCTRCRYRCPGEDIREDILAGKPPLCPRCQENPLPSLIQPINSVTRELYSISRRSSSFESSTDVGSMDSTSATSQKEEDTTERKYMEKREANDVETKTMSSFFQQDRVFSLIDPIFDQGCMKPNIVFFGEPLPGHFFDRIEEDVKNCDLLLVMGTSLKVAPVSRIIEMLEHKVPQILVNREVVAKPHEFDVEFLGNCDAVTTALAKKLGWNIAKETQFKEAAFRRSQKRNRDHRYLFEGGIESETDDEGYESDESSLADSEESNESENGENPRCSLTTKPVSCCVSRENSKCENKRAIAENAGTFDKLSKKTKFER